MTDTISSTITNSVTLGAGGYGSPLTVTSTGDIAPASAGGVGIYVAPRYAAGSITNDGTIGGGTGSAASYALAGTGGDGISIVGTANVTNNMLIVGGKGGASYYGGNGGVGVDLHGGGTLTNLGTISGGVGYGKSTGLGIGGTGGAGLILDSLYTAGETVSNAGLIVGGYGGIGYNAGAGASGVSISNGDELVNTGTIMGGSGGVSSNPGFSGTGGVGVFLDGGILLDSGTIIGGYSGNQGATGGAAIQFGTAASTLAITPSAVLTGKIDASSAAHDVLALEPGAGSLSGFGTNITGFSTLDFQGAGSEWTVSGTDTAFTALQGITGFQSGDALSLAGFSEASETYVAGTGLELSNGVSTITLAFQGALKMSNFAVSAAAGATTIAYSTTAPCFCAGTQILTVSGEKPVEDIRVGDEVVLHGGGKAAVIWVGSRRVSIENHAQPALVAPVLIAAGAIIDGVPGRDLLVSPDHALFLGGRLIPAKTLINGTSVRQLGRQKVVTYFHIELAEHAVIYADGTPAESYLDTGNRGEFEEASAKIVSHPLHAQAMRESMSCAPFADHGPAVEAIRAGMLTRAGIQITREPDIEIVRRQDGGVLVLTNSGIPGHLLADPRDCRELGVKIAVVKVGGEPIDLAHPLLIDGWHDPESDGRWTNGRAVIPAALVRGQPVEVEIAASAAYARRPAFPDTPAVGE